MKNRKITSQYNLIVFLIFLSVQMATGQNKWQRDIGTIHSALPKTKLLDGADSYFEITKTAQLGDEVIGRINLANNSFEEVEFEIIEGADAHHFKMEKFINSNGKHFGVFKVKALPLSKGAYEVNVKATFNNGVTDTQTYTINKVDTPLAETLLTFAHSNLSRSHRLYFRVSDTKTAQHLSKLRSDGTFSDLRYGLSKSGWEGLNKGAERINNLAMAYLTTNSTYYKDEDLKQKVYTAIIFNSKEFAKYRTEWYETHLWRNTDYIAGIGINFFEILKEEMNSSNSEVAQKAIEVYDAIIDNCDNLFAERMNERPAIGNANRNHRMRSLIVRAAISYDYNRALTDWDLWYDKVDARIPGFYPDGAINDLMELVETSFVSADTYNNMNGFFPDGTICHHPAVGIQFTADAYGWQWLTEWSLPLANLFKDTHYQAQDLTYNVIADRLLDAYRPLTYYGYLDISVGGLIIDRKRWGGRLLKAIDDLVAAKSNSTTIKREEELLEYKASIGKVGYDDPLSMSKAFWNIDYLIQRSPNYFVSVKMNSTRSRGLERGLENRSYYYLGDGALFIRVNPDDYNNIESYYNWHAIPGTTAEQRTDDMPPNAESAYSGANGTNTFAGVVSNGSIGFGAFKYERNHQKANALYSTVNANKGYFFFEENVVALGNNIRRVRTGDGADILTTLNQMEWRGDITFGQVGKEKIEFIPISDQNNIHHLKALDKPFWVYHDQVGYVIVPEKNKTVDVDLIAETRDPKWTNATAKKRIFFLAIDHGTDVSDNSYQYHILPNTTADKVAEFAQSMGENEVRVLENKTAKMAVYNTEHKIVQAAFYEAGELSFTTDDGENIYLSVDKPALVMMKNNGETIEYSVTDPYHSTSSTTIHLQVNIKLKGETFNETNKLTQIAFTHPSDELYAGKPMVQSFETQGTFLTRVHHQEVDRDEITIFFNCTNQKIQLVADTVFNKMNVSLYNLSGQLIARKEMDYNNGVNAIMNLFDTVDLQHGLYMVEVTAKNRTQRSKILINC